MSDDHDNHDDHISTVGITGSYKGGGPLDGLEFMLWVPPGLDLTDMRVSVPQGGKRATYLYDPQTNPAASEAGFRFIGHTLA